MTKFGEISPEPQKAFTLNVKCKSNGHDGDHEEYQAPEGWMIYETSNHEVTHRGNTLIWDGDLFRGNMKTLDRAAFEEAFAQLTGGFADILKMHNDIAGTITNLLKAGDNWPNTWKARAFCDTDVGYTAKLYRDYFVNLIYVGIKDDVYPNLTNWLSGIPIVKGFTHEIKSSLSFRCKEHLLNPDTNILYVHEPPGGLENPSVFFDSPVFPEKSSVKFKVKVASENPQLNRKMNLAIWQMTNTPKLLNETQRIDVTDWQELTLDATVDEKAIIRAEIYWHDNEFTNVLIDMNSIQVIFSKTF